MSAQGLLERGPDTPVVLGRHRSQVEPGGAVALVELPGELRIGELTPVAPATWGPIKHLYRRDR